MPDVAQAPPDHPIATEHAAPQVQSPPPVSTPAAAPGPPPPLPPDLAAGFVVPPRPPLPTAATPGASVPVVDPEIAAEERPADKANADAGSTAVPARTLVPDTGAEAETEAAPGVVPEIDTSPATEDSADGEAVPRADSGTADTPSGASGPTDPAAAHVEAVIGSHSDVEPDSEIDAGVHDTPSLPAEVGVDPAVFEDETESYPSSAGAGPRERFGWAARISAGAMAWVATVNAEAANAPARRWGGLKTGPLAPADPAVIDAPTQQTATATVVSDVESGSGLAVADRDQVAMDLDRKMADGDLDMVHAATPGTVQTDPTSGDGALTEPAVETIEPVDKTLTADNRDAADAALTELGLGDTPGDTSSSATATALPATDVPLEDVPVPTADDAVGTDSAPVPVLAPAPVITGSLPESLVPVIERDGPAVLELRGVSKSFGGSRAVETLDLSVPVGTFYGLVGPNGAGKTTTLSMISGLLRPDKGTIEVAGIDAVRRPIAAKRQMGVLPDRLRTFDRLTGRQLLYYYGVLRGLNASVVERRTADLAEAFDFSDALARVVSDYSAGMLKKVMLAGAMIHAPRLLVLDEPFEAVDPVSSATILEILSGYVAHGGTVILSSHGMELVERMCSRVAVIVAGQVLAEGTIDEVRGELTLEQRFVELAGGLSDVEGLEWLHTFSA